jgi:hypothetical protein
VGNSGGVGDPYPTKPVPSGEVTSGPSQGGTTGQDGGNGTVNGSTPSRSDGSGNLNGDPGIDPVPPPPTDTGPVTVDPGATGTPAPSPPCASDDPTPDPTCTPTPEVPEYGMTPEET